jgi:hypothetical protein
MYAMQHPFQQIVGVELHQQSAQLAELNLQRHALSNAAKCQCLNFQVLCQDMQTFDFSLPSSTHTAVPAAAVKSIVLYMYEPLWTLPKAEAYQIYSSILSDAIYDSPSHVKEVYFVYLLGGTYGGDALTAIEEIKRQQPSAVQLAYEGKYYSLFFGYVENMYIYKTTLANLTDVGRKDWKKAVENGTDGGKNRKPMI